MQISGSSAIVVGGAGGLGEATVRRLSAAGAKVVIADLADDKGKELAGELGARYVRTDATNTDDVNAALAEAESLAPLRISVDAHGGPASGGRLVGKDGAPLDLDGFKTTIDVYLTGVFNVLRLAAAAMARQDPVDEGARGVIINTASIAAYEGQIGQLPYAAAKGGVVGMTLVAARDLSPLGIRVVTIAPGTFLTPAYGQAGDQLEAYWGRRFPSPSGWADPPSTAPSCKASSKTITSTAKSSDWMGRCASRRSSRRPEGAAGRTFGAQSAAVRPLGA